MKSFSFKKEIEPFPRWMGPFSPARGTRSGFRFHQGKLGTWVSSETGLEFWSVKDGKAARDIYSLVRGKWGGGRILLLPNGFVVKPLQADDEIGCRVLIGYFNGKIILQQSGHQSFDMSNPGKIYPGSKWIGPTLTGLECVIQSDGSLQCKWYHPTPSGQDEVSCSLRGPDKSLSMGFRTARPGSQGGRVRITANGHIITNRQDANGGWTALYVGWIDPQSLMGWEKWIQKESKK